jgi:tetratricopeptide (TPR) repeat protein
VPLRLARQAGASQPRDRTLRYRYLRTLGAACLRAGRFDEAVRQLHETLLEEHPREDEVPVFDWLWLALAHQKLGHADKARECLAQFDQAVRRHSPEPAHGVYRLEVQAVYGSPYPRSFETREAKGPPPDKVLASRLPWEDRLEYRFLRQEAEELVRSHGRLVERGSRHARQGRWEQAAADFAKALADLPGDSPERTAVYAELRKWEKVLARTVELRPDDGPLRLERGRSFAERGRWQEAAAEFARAFALRPPEDPHLWFQHACLRLLVEDAAGYRQVCADMLRHFGRPRDAEAAFTLARTCLLAPEAGVDLRRVVRLARQAAAGDKFAWHLYGLGLAQYRAGQFDRAAQALHEALRAAPGTCPRGEVWLVLAMAHRRLGHAEQARRWLEKAVEWMDREGRKGQGALPAPRWQDWAECVLLRRQAEEVVKRR